ncbi:helix-turn-helix domain-containing protein [Sulfuriroseicoccus oceanibius]|uniref:Helix-turn-helix domain-containing protein n=1 Tax=Sulfuriroseicoccus oceanibius TaxID=2707525 RepID=A0A6B3L039_9BACT|nr:helix-turn-helix domain-containing protein [Sulfuriroseicoccus oceanibius]QQL43706.1 helix-turn-helix domain-containing protein [Sulfuriroseicoccus oceanibius]
MKQLPQITKHDESLITTRELARRLKVTERTIENWRRDGRIPALKIGRAVRFLWSDVIDALKSPE